MFTVCRYGEGDVGTPRVDGTTVGLYKITASDGDKEVEHNLYITPALADLAHGKPSVSSSEENAGTLTANVNDGDATTRSTLMDIIGCGPDTRVSVYTIDGRPVRLNVEASEATKSLPAGLYIVGDAKLY